MVASACSPSSLGGWGKRITSAWEVEPAVSHHCATVPQPRWQSKTSSQKAKPYIRVPLLFLLSVNDLYSLQSWLSDSMFVLGLRIIWIMLLSLYIFNVCLKLSSLTLQVENIDPIYKSSHISKRFLANVTYGNKLNSWSHFKPTQIYPTDIPISRKLYSLT